MAERCSPVSRYRFGHVLFRDYLYTHLDAVRRAHLHGMVGQALESLCEGEEAALAAMSSRLAHHFEQAGRVDKAAGYLRLAGRQATRMAAYDEAIALFRRGQKLLARLPAGPERSRLEKEILVDLFLPLMPMRGWASAERMQVTHKVLDLACQESSSAADLMGALFMRAEVLNSQAKHAESLDLAELLLHLAEGSGEAAYLALAHYQRGQNRFFSGQAGCADDFRQVLGYYDRRQHAALLPWTDGDLGVRCLGLLAVALAFEGYVDQGRAASREAMAVAQEMGHPLTEAVSLTFAGCSFCAACREVELAGTYARRLLAVSAERRLPIFRPYALIYDGWAQALAGGGRAAIDQMRTALAEWQATGHRAGVPFLHVLLAEALWHSGARDEALVTVEAGLALAQEVGAPHGADLYRLKGEILDDDQHGHSRQAEVCLQAALRQARQQGNLLLELRAAVSLGRMWGAQGRQEEARGLVATVYSRFTEGFDAVDLVEARASLAVK